MQDDFYDPIYKGCTSPSTMGGVALMPFIFGVFVIAYLSVLSFYFTRLSITLVILMIGLFAWLWARKVSSNDEYRLLQYMMKMRMRGRQSATRKLWGAVSFSPLPPRK